MPSVIVIPYSLARIVSKSPLPQPTDSSHLVALPGSLGQRFRRRVPDREADPQGLPRVFPLPRLGVLPARRVSDAAAADGRTLRREPQLRVTAEAADDREVVAHAA